MINVSEKSDAESDMKTKVSVYVSKKERNNEADKKYCCENKGFSRDVSV